MITVYVSIGNSDNTLTQREYSGFVDAVRAVVASYADRVHGQWFSASASPYQNACWCFEIDETKIDALKHNLRCLARDFRQGSIAWATAQTEFLTPTGWDVMAR